MQSLKEQKECQDNLKTINWPESYFLLVNLKIGFYSEHGTDEVNSL